MKIVVQHPFADLRSLTADVAAFLPNLPGRTKDTGIVDSLRHFGWAEARKADLAFPDESCYYGAHRALRMIGLGRRVLAAQGVEVEPRILSYRRLFITDQRVSARVEIGLRLHARQKPLEFDGLMGLLGTVLELPSQVPSAVDRAGSSASASLGRQGRALASHYAKATSTSRTKVDRLAPKLVRPCLPVVLVALRHGEMVPREVGTRLPYFRRLEREHTADVDVWYGQLDDSGRKVPCWLLSPGSAKTTALENLGLCLLRLHADNRAVEEVLRWLESAPAVAIEPDRVSDYLRYVKDKVLDRIQRASLGQSAIVQAIAAVTETRPEDKALHLRERLDRALRKVSMPARQSTVDQGLDRRWRRWVDGLERKPDLVVVIQRSGSSLLWTFLSPHPLDLPLAVEKTEIGSDGLDAFAGTVANAVDQNRYTPLLFHDVRGIGELIGNRIPRTLWRLLTEISGATGRPPTVLLLSEEPFVPWELALESRESSFLAARALVGRWVFPKDDEHSPPPPVEIRIRAAALIAGRYHGEDDLPEAREEVRAIQDHLHRVRPSTEITRLEAEGESMLAYFKRRADDNLVHFAVHGSFDPSSREDGILATNGWSLSAFAVRDFKLPGKPFVFLNACQLGRGKKLLNISTGLAESFVTAGASAVIAPLWTIDDDVAHAISIALYRAALRGEGGQPVAEFLRTQRDLFGEDTLSPTSLAYRFFGHPECRLTLAA